MSAALKLRDWWPIYTLGTGRSPELPTHVMGRIRDESVELRSYSDRQLAETSREMQTLASREADRKSRRELAIATQFALVCEALRRISGMEYYDVQLRAGYVLAMGHVTEMATGEGKTITAALPAFFHATRGRQVHVATTNTYLAERDFQTVAPLLRLLGLTVGLLPASYEPTKTRDAYRCDVVYGTAYQFGFDYLRDQVYLRRNPALPIRERVRLELQGRQVQHSLLQPNSSFAPVAIIDEIDSQLIDEANTPLILCTASPAKESPTPYRLAASVVGSFVEGIDFEFEDRLGVCHLTPHGVAVGFEHLSQAGRLPLSRSWSRYLCNAIVARHQLRRDVDYVVVNDTVQLVDTYTGRIVPDRSWSSGLKQAVEVHEELPISPPQQATARITRQRYFRHYSQLCGMTGTALGSEFEFRTIYQMRTIAIPRHQACNRKTYPARYFATELAKWRAIATELAAQRGLQQPVLIGTNSIRASQGLSQTLTQFGVVHVVLNGLQDETEAAIIAAAGRAGNVTVATNLAGRGTDIPLDDTARQAGGLHVIASEPHTSHRVARQLIGRCARQGDPGSCQSMASAEDTLIVKYGGKLSQRMKLAADADGQCHGDFSRDISAVQRRVQRQLAIQRQRLMVQDYRNARLLDTFLNKEPS